jgi:thioredoxin 1
MATSKEIISSFSNRDEFLQLLTVNPGLIIIKYGASWCGPCKKIAPLIDAFFMTSPDTVICADIDVDESMDLYSFMKNKRMINGIPAIMCYKKGNTTYIPDDMITGADPTELHSFFKRCGMLIATINKK